MSLQQVVNQQNAHINQLAKHVLENINNFNSVRKDLDESRQEVKTLREQLNMSDKLIQNFLLILPFLCPGFVFKMDYHYTIFNYFYCSALVLCFIYVFKFINDITTSLNSAGCSLNT